MVSEDPSLVNAREADGTAILTAVYHRQKEIVNLLVARGAALSLFEAAAAGEIERVERLIGESPSDLNAFSPDGWTPLHAALAANQKMAAGLLIGHGADLDAPDGGGWRPLHLAAANNNLDSMRTLVAQGADLSATNKDGLTPIAMAEQKNHKEAAAFLKRHGAVG